MRAKVACLRAAELPPGGQRSSELGHARSLAELGERLSWRARRPLVLVVCGASATGKTYLARELARSSGLAHLSSDVVRKELAGLAPEQRAPVTEYSEEASLRTYAEVGARAAAAVGSGGAVVDATFRRGSDRAAFRRRLRGRHPLAGVRRVPCTRCGDRQRAQRRERDPHHTSDATVEIAARQLAEFEPLDEVEPDLHVIVRSDREVRDARR